ncbi:sensor histidine kinase [Amycolatopsis minnesotensis]|uniref:histidine kinase n=1 Tax=Amycolatopsis minnesotensis TaxID=337894 RepID=A0ABP5CQG4_9PSEU
MFRDHEGRRIPTVGDVLLTVAPTAFVVGATTVFGHWQQWHDSRPLDVLGYAWLVCAGLPLLLNRRFPLTAFLLSGVLGWTYFWPGYPGGPVLLLAAIALFLLTKHRGPLVAGLAGGGLVVAGLVAQFVRGGLELNATAAIFPTLMVAVIGIATAVRTRISAIRATRERAAEHQQRLAEQERLRIAREVHDVVAHSLAMINVQAGVGAHVADRRPDQAKEALRTIKEASAAALVDLRATLAVLRGAEPHAPAPSLRQMAELLDHTRATGLHVRVHGSPGDLPAPTDAAAYRILQESLTNVVRHANQPKVVDVRFSRADGMLELVVHDDGMGAREPKAGNGLRGMRERAEALGGQVLAAAVVDGFEVRAVLPVEGGE